LLPVVHLGKGSRSKSQSRSFSRGRTRATISQLFISRKIPIDYVFNTIKDQPRVRRSNRSLLHNPRGHGSRDYCAFHDGCGHLTVNCRTLRQHLQELVNQGYLREFIFNFIQLSEIRVQRQPKTMDECPGSDLIQYREVNAIFGTSPVEGTTAKGRAIYVNEARRDSYLAILTCPPSPLDIFVFFLKEDAYVVHFPHNDALVMTIHIDCCNVSKISANGGSSVNILYGHTLD